eukprot:Hpha_TRINITY_DN13163_c0_g1::TRINITY_DN13163_c0_g1_i1::g.113552::m.113552
MIGRRDSVARLSNVLAVVAPKANLDAGIDDVGEWADGDLSSPHGGLPHAWSLDSLEGQEFFRSSCTPKCKPAPVPESDSPVRVAAAWRSIVSAFAAARGEDGAIDDVTAAGLFLLTARLHAESICDNDAQIILDGATQVVGAALARQDSIPGSL